MITSNRRQASISVITVVRNDAPGLMATANSVFRQVGADYEYLVKDGSSEPETPELIGRLDDWIDWSETGSDSGVYEAMNYAVRKSNGVWVNFLNAADVYVDETALARLSAACDASVDIVYSDVVDIHTGRVHRYRPLNEFWAGNTFDHQSCLIRHSVLEDIPFREDLTIAGDLDFFSRCHLAGASVRRLSGIVVAKPFDEGLSASFTGRFSERFAVLQAHFGDRYPVKETLEKELLEYAGSLGLRMDPALSIADMLSEASAAEAELNRRRGVA
jgi:hypothetical protein